MAKAVVRIRQPKLKQAAGASITVASTTVASILRGETMLLQLDGLVFLLRPRLVVVMVAGKELDNNITFSLKVERENL